MKVERRGCRGIPLPVLLLDLGQHPVGHVRGPPPAAHHLVEHCGGNEMGQVESAWVSR